MSLYSQWSPQTITWWEHLLLLFVPEQKASDEHDGITTTVYFKIMKGKLYITDVIESFSFSVVLKHSKKT